MNSLSTTMKLFPNNGKYFDNKNYLQQTFYPQLKNRHYNDSQIYSFISILSLEPQPSTSLHQNIFLLASLTVLKIIKTPKVHN